MNAIQTRYQLRYNPKARKLYYISACLSIQNRRKTKNFFSRAEKGGDGRAMGIRKGERGSKGTRRLRKEAQQKRHGEGGVFADNGNRKILSIPAFMQLTRGGGACIIEETADVKE